MATATSLDVAQSSIGLLVYQEHRIWRPLLRHSGILIGGAIILVTVVIGVLAPVLAPADPYQTNPPDRLLPPGTAGYMLGTDELGRDLASRLMYGARLSLAIGAVAALFAASIGLTVGAMTGFLGGWFDVAVMRMVDVMLSFPYILLAIVIVAIIGPGLRNTILAVAVLGIPYYVRVVRAQVLSIKERDYVMAARALGCSTSRIIFRTIMPNAVSPVITAFSLHVGWLILEAAGLGFLGLGAQPPTAEWGAMLSQSRQYFTLTPHVVLLPGLCIFVLVFGCNLFGEGLRDVLDPRLRMR